MILKISNLTPILLYYINVSARNRGKAYGTGNIINYRRSKAWGNGNKDSGANIKNIKYEI